MALLFLDGFDHYSTYDEAKETVEALKNMAKKHDMPIIMTGQRWKPKEGENVIRILPSEVPGGDKMQYEPSFTVRILKNRNEKPEIDVVGNNPVAAAELEELCEWHDEVMERVKREHKWGDRGITLLPFEEGRGEAVTPDMAANAAMLREQLRVETNVRLALAEKQDAQNSFFSEEPKRIDYFGHLDVVPTATGWADKITSEPLQRL